MCGQASAIIAGLVSPLVGGSTVTIVDPAGTCRGMFQNPVVEPTMQDGRYERYIDRPRVGFNSAQLAREFEPTPPEAKAAADPRRM